jgi:hypothetical protein
VSDEGKTELIPQRVASDSETHRETKETGGKGKTGLFDLD